MLSACRSHHLRTVLPASDFKDHYGTALIVSLFLILKLTLDYSQIFLLYLDNPYLSCKEIMHQEQNLMKGNRIRYFYLLVSFVGIALLGVVSLGIGFLWITPYMSMTEVEFYRDLINEHSQEF